MLDEGKKKILYNIQLSDEAKAFEISDNYFIRIKSRNISIMWMKYTFNWFKKYKTIKIFLIQDTEDIIHFICMTKWLFNI